MLQSQAIGVLEQAATGKIVRAEKLAGALGRAHLGEPVGFAATCHVLRPVMSCAPAWIECTETEGGLTSPMG